MAVSSNYEENSIQKKTIETEVRSFVDYLLIAFANILLCRTTCYIYPCNKTVGLSVRKHIIVKYCDRLKEFLKLHLLLNTN